MGGVLAMVAHLYEVEKVSRLQGLRGEPLRLAREQGARPMLNQLHEYLLVIREQVLPKSEAGQAIAYTLKNWTALTRYCSDGDLSIDNNATERSLRSFAVGRNNWTFFGSDNGGKTAAVLRSFISTCELVKVDPFAWFRDVLVRIAEHPMSRLDELLPHRWAQTSR
jgi:transposase